MHFEFELLVHITYLKTAAEGHTTDVRQRDELARCELGSSVYPRVAAESEGVCPTLRACKTVMSEKQLESMNKQS